jgi:hypothetical protein
LFHGCDLIIPQSGVLAVPLAGVVVGNMATPVDRDLREFKDQLTILLVGLLFILLAADVSLADVRNLGWRGFAVVGALVLVVRPLCVFLCTIKSKLNVRERVFVAWIAPRGIVAAAIASLVAAAMETQQMAGAADLRALVFLTIAGTVLLAGLTARPVATLLGVRLPGRDRVAILGAHGLGLALGARLKEARVPVVFIDADPRRCQQAQEAGFAVVFGDGLQERTMLRAQVELVGTAIGGTPNAHLNTLFVNQAREMFGVPRCCVVVDAMAGEKAPPHVERHETEVLFDGPHDAGTCAGGTGRC